MTHLTFFNPPMRRPLAEPFFAPFRFGLPEAGYGRRIPPVNVQESETDLRIEAELPGVPRENIAVRFHGGRLTVEGKRNLGLTTGESEGEPKPTPPEGCTLRERREGTFYRSFELPDTVDASRIRAEARDGLLTVVLPKAEAVLPRRIEVTVS